MAAIARKYFERHALASALGAAVMSGSGMDVGQVREGFQTEKDITTPMISVYFLPSTYLELQIGRVTTGDKSFTRRVQIDIYMPTEALADAVSDLVSDFIDEFSAPILDASGTSLGSLYCPDSESIRIALTLPTYKEEKILRWRSVVQATLEADYFSA